jgi:hypothetical protein
VLSGLGATAVSATGHYPGWSAARSGLLSPEPTE